MQQQRNNVKMKRKLEMTRAKLEKLQCYQKLLSKMKDIAKSNHVYPLSNIQDLIKLNNETSAKIENIELKTKDVNWDKIALMGQKPDLEFIQPKTKTCFHVNTKADVSSWEITRDFRDAVAIGSAKDIEFIQNIISS